MKEQIKRHEIQETRDLTDEEIFQDGIERFLVMAGLRINQSTLEERNSFRIREDTRDYFGSESSRIRFSVLTEN